jgi:hypothetical protein
MPARMAGTSGSDARALGAALLPLYIHFAPDRDLFQEVGVQGLGSNAGGGRR